MVNKQADWAECRKEMLKNEDNKAGKEWNKM